MKNLVLVFLLTGCGIAADIETSRALDQSKAAYKSCIERGGACEKERVIYETDLKAYNARTMRGW